MTVNISVVMPVYNAEKYIGDAVSSILRQTYQDFELIIVDDGSTDSSIDLVKTFQDKRIKIYHQSTNQGFISALRLGITQASGEWVARMDADDVSDPVRLEIQREFLLEHPDCVFVGSSFHYISPAGKFISRLQSDNVNEGWRYVTREMLTFSQQTFADPSVMFHRQKALLVGLYDDDFPYEIPFWYKLLRVGKGAELFSQLHFYRININSLSRKPRKSDEQNISLIVRKRYDPDNVQYIEHRFNKASFSRNNKRKASLLQAIRLCLLTKDRKIALKLLAITMFEFPLEIQTWKYLIKIMFGLYYLHVGSYADGGLGEHEFRPQWLEKFSNSEPK